MFEIVTFQHIPTFGLKLKVKKTVVGAYPTLADATDALHTMGEVEDYDEAGDHVAFTVINEDGEEVFGAIDFPIQ